MLGQVIHGYRIDRALAEDKGGFGDVYFAVHVDSGAEAVVKVLKPEMSAQRDIVARFFNEARAAASVHHPGVVQIHNVGYHGDRAYLLMERLRGDDLEARLAAGPLPVERAIVFLRQAAGAVGAAHERGIVHRDLKPANLFVVADPDVIGGERVKVLDFGIAKLTADAGAGKTQGVFGTPAYMSPEQCASTGAVDARADLYSLGCIFYELVSGRPPFGQGGIELIAAHLRDTPPPPRAIAPWVPPAVEQVILQLLEKQPERRIPTCAALIAALDEAAAASGLVGASSPYLPAGGAGNPAFAAPTRPGAALHATTLGASAGSVTSPPEKRSVGVWLGVGAIVVVVGAVAAVLAIPGHSPAGGGPGGPQGSGGGSVGSGLVVAPRDAGAGIVASDASVRAGSTLDAAAIAADTPDAASGSALDAAGSTQAEIAERLDEEGKLDLGARAYESARQRFTQAAARVPLARYFVGIATADIGLGQLGAAADALRQALLHSPSDADRSAMSKQFHVVAREARDRGLAIAPPISAAELRGESAPAAGDDITEPPVTRLRSQADIAEDANEQGKKLMYSARYLEALSKFQEAVARVPQPKYFINLCVATFQLGRFGEALTACKAVALNDPTPEQRTKAATLILRIRQEAERQGLDLRSPD